METLRDRGVQAWGADISEFAIQNVREDIRPYCRVASITKPIPLNAGRYDLVACIEVLEHLTAEEAGSAIANLTAVTDTILFSSSPSDFNEPTHINVRPPIDWLQMFAAHGFSPDLGSILHWWLRTPCSSEEMCSLCLPRCRSSTMTRSC